jgi:precorrin-6B methylase 2
MTVSKLRRGATLPALAALLALVLAPAPQAHANGAKAPAAKADKREYEPQVGQAGKDVVWVPTALALVNKMLDMAKMTSDDYVIDLGSGDGRTVITAAKRGAKAALGIEYNPNMVELSKRNAEREGVADKAQFVRGDIFETDFSQATVLTMFLLPELNVKLRPTILKMKPGTRVVTNSFSMGDWEADATESVDSNGCTSYCTAYLWIVPANAAGTWKLPQGELVLEQKYQMLSGSLKGAAVAGRMNGEQIAFKVGEAEYAGKVVGDRMEGVVRTGGKEEKFQATRAK